MTARKVPDDVQAWHDSLTDEEKTAFALRLTAANKTLADMKIAKSTGKLDQRQLIPHKENRVANFDWRKKVEAKLANGEELTEKERTALERQKAVALNPPPTEDQKIKLDGKKLPKDKDLAGYIKDTLGDGKALADFYIEILTLSVAECRKRGIFMNHKLAAANWLGERGWGKAKGEEADKGITINLIDHSSVNVAERPPIQASAIEIKTEDDIGRDVDTTKLVDALPEPEKQTDTPMEIDLENFSLRE